MMKLFPVIATVSLLSLAGCSAIEHGFYQEIEVTSSPSNAYCQISREKDGVLGVVVTPGTRYIATGADPITVTCHRDGYVSGQTVAPSSNRDLNAANILTLGSSLISDVRGAGYYYPDHVFVGLDEKSEE